MLLFINSTRLTFDLELQQSQEINETGKKNCMNTENVSVDYVALNKVEFLLTFPVSK